MVRSKTVKERITVLELEKRKAFKKVIEEEIEKQLGFKIIIPRVMISKFLGIKPVEIKIIVELPRKRKKRPKIYKLP